MLLILLALAQSETARELITQARAAAGRGDAATADELLSRAESDPPSEVNVLRGNVAAFVKKDAESSLPFYRAAIEADPNNSNAHYFLGRVLTPSQPDEAAKYLEEAARLAPSNVAPEGGLPIVKELTIAQELGTLEARRGSWDGTASRAARAAALNVHGSAQPLLALAQTALKLGRPLDALLTYREVAELHPWHAQPMVELAQLVHKLDKAGGDHATAFAAAASAHSANGIPRAAKEPAAGAPSARVIYTTRRRRCNHRAALSDGPARSMRQAAKAVGLDVPRGSPRTHCHPLPLPP